MKVFFFNKTISVLVNHVESLLKLLNLRLIKHSKYIGGGSLRSLLGVLSLGSFARHVDCGWVSFSCETDTYYIGGPFPVSGTKLEYLTCAK